MAEQTLWKHTQLVLSLPYHGQVTSYHCVWTLVPWVGCGFGFSEILFPWDNVILEVPSFLSFGEDCFSRKYTIKHGWILCPEGHQTGHRSQQETACFLACEPGGISSLSFWELVPWQTGFISHEQKHTCLNICKQCVYVCVCMCSHAHAHV